MQFGTWILIFLIPGVLLVLHSSNRTGEPGASPLSGTPIQTDLKIIAEDAGLITLAEGFRFTEGPAVDSSGNIYFTDQPNDRILRWSVDGELSTFLQPSGRSNGLYFDGEGNLLACADEKNELWSISPKKEVTVLVDRYQGKLLNGPNDLWVHPDQEWIYFTDPYYQRGYWNRGSKEQEVEGVYRLTRSTGQLERVVDDLVQPNGIIGTPDGKTLYIADIGAGVTYRYAIQPDGSLAGKEKFCDMGSDGMTIDNKGNVYLTGQGVTVFNNRGEKLGNIPIDKKWTANVCFGGREMDTLFITAMDSLFAIQMRVRGVR